ncbi:MAG: hypothetical protein V4690_00395 [Patescibacteria group bacterium]
MQKNEFKIGIIVWVVVFLVALMSPSPASAQTVSVPVVQEESAGTSVVFTTALRKAYIGLQGGMYHDDMVQQSDLTVTLPSGLYFSGWGSTDFTNQKNYGKEFDAIIGFSYNVGEVNIDVNQQYFVLQGYDALNTNAEVSFRSVFVSGEIYFPARMTNDDVVLENGWAVNAGIRKDFSKGAFGFSFEEGVRYDSGAFGYEPAWIHRGYLGISLEMNSKTTFFTGVRLTQPITNVTDRSRFVNWEIGISRTR